MEDTKVQLPSKAHTTVFQRFDQALRVINLMVVAVLVGLVTKVFHTIPILRVQVCEVLIVMVLMEYAMATPLSVISTDFPNLVCHVVLFFDFVCEAFILTICISISSGISAIHDLNQLGAVSDLVYNISLTIVVLAWIGFCSHGYVLLKWLYYCYTTLKINGEQK